MIYQGLSKKDALKQLGYCQSLYKDDETTAHLFTRIENIKDRIPAQALFSLICAAEDLSRAYLRLKNERSQS